MPLAADLVRVAFVEQTGNPPVTPANPIFTVARLTGETVAFAPTTTISAEFDASGNIRDSILTGGESTGDLSLEVSDHAAFETYIEAVLGAAFVADALKNAPAQRFFLIEKTFPDIPATGSDSYHRFNKSSFGTLTLSIAPGAPINATIGTLGGELTLGTAIIAGATYPDPGTNPVLVPQDVEVSIAGIASTACFSSVELSFDTGSRSIQCIGTLGTKETVRGRLNCTIAATLYYASDDPVQALIDQSEFSVRVTLKDNNDNPEYTFLFPRCKATAAPVTAEGTDTDVTVAMEIQALYDEATGATVLVARQPAVPGTPISMSAPVISGTGAVGSVVSMDSGGYWEGTDPITYTNSWRNNGAAFVPAETGATLDMSTALPAPVAGSVITLIRTATNAIAATPATSNALTVV